MLDRIVEGMVSWPIRIEDGLFFIAALSLSKADRAFQFYIFKQIFTAPAIHLFLLSAPRTFNSSRRGSDGV